MKYLMLKRLTPLFITLFILAGHNLYAADEIAPTVTIDQAAVQADPTPVLYIEFTVVFSEPVTGFQAGDISFAGSTADTSRALVFLHPPENNLYRVSVTNIASGGVIKVSIPAGSVIDSQGNPNSASTSSDNSVTYNPNYVLIGGQVKLSSGRILSNVNLELILPSGEHRFARTNSFGYYRFNNIQTANIIILVTGKRTIGATVGFNLWNDYPNLNIELLPN
jgi:hypothetical protein